MFTTKPAVVHTAENAGQIVNPADNTVIDIEPGNKIYNTIEYETSNSGKLSYRVVRNIVTNKVGQDGKPILTKEDLELLKQVFGAKGEVMPPDFRLYNFRIKVTRYHLKAGLDVTETRPEIEDILEKIIRAGGEISTEC